MFNEKSFESFSLRGRDKLLKENKSAKMELLDRAKGYFQKQFSLIYMFEVLELILTSLQ